MSALLWCVHINNGVVVRSSFTDIFLIFFLCFFYSLGTSTKLCHRLTVSGEADISTRPPYSQSVTKLFCQSHCLSSNHDSCSILPAHNPRDTGCGITRVFVTVRMSEDAEVYITRYFPTLILIMFRDLGLVLGFLCERAV